MDMGVNSKETVFYAYIADNILDQSKQEKPEKTKN